MALDQARVTCIHSAVIHKSHGEPFILCHATAHFAKAVFNRPIVAAAGGLSRSR